jgi:hypothetical protein
MRHLSLIEEAPSENRQAMKNTAGMLTQIETQLETANLRLRSLEKRMKNVISLVRRFLQDSMHDSFSYAKALSK